MHQAAQKFSFDHAGNVQIAGVPGPARYLVDAVNAPDRCADDREITLLLAQVKTFLFPERSSYVCLASTERYFETAALCRYILAVYWR